MKGFNTLICLIIVILVNLTLAQLGGFRLNAGKYRANELLRKAQRRQEIYNRVCKAIGCPVSQKQNADLNIETLPVPTEIDAVLPVVQEGDYPLFSEPLPSTNDSSCMQFPFREMELDGGYIISRADVLVFIRMSKKAMKRKRKKKIVIKIATLDEAKDKRKVVARLKFRPKRPSRYRVALPLSVLRKLSKRKDKNLKICIECRKCNRRVDVALLRHTKRQRRRKSKSKSKRRKKMQNDSPRDKSLSKNRPILVYTVRTTAATARLKRDITRSRRNQNDAVNSCDSDSQTNSCCTTQSYVSFRDMGLHRLIMYPNGFNFSHCVGSCDIPASDLVDIQSQNQTGQCTPVKYEPLQIFVVLSDEIGFITLRKGIVHKCACVSTSSM